MLTRDNDWENWIFGWRFIIPCNVLELNRLHWYLSAIFSNTNRSVIYLLHELVCPKCFSQTVKFQHKDSHFTHCS